MGARTSICSSGPAASTPVSGTVGSCWALLETRDPAETLEHVYEHEIETIEGEEKAAIANRRSPLRRKGIARRRSLRRGRAQSQAGFY